MKFLAKHPASAVAVAGMRYVIGRDNSGLRRLLLREQKGFCAYTEKVFEDLDAVDVEHFDSRKKGQDDYFNYYAVLHSANQRKRRKERAAEGARFFETLFFQSKDEFTSRIAWVAETNAYEEVDLADNEARELIEFLGFNDPELWLQRRKHLDTLAELFRLAGLDESGQRAWLERHPEQLSFVSALELHLGLDLTDAVEAHAARLGAASPAQPPPG
jgi:hypothetical protein